MQTIEQRFGHVRAKARALALPATLPRAVHHCDNCAVGACCDCGSLSPWRCGCNAEDEAGQEPECPTHPSMRTADCGCQSGNGK